jgi:hypothetical protein
MYSIPQQKDVVEISQSCFYLKKSGTPHTNTAPWGYFVPAEVIITSPPIRNYKLAYILNIYKFFFIT